MFSGYNTVVGAGKMGKSYYTKTELKKYSGAVIYVNYINDINDWNGYIKISCKTDVGIIKSLITKNKKLVFFTSDNEKKKAKEILWFWGYIKSIKKMNIAFVLDEVHLMQDIKELKIMIKETATIGRHKCDIIVWITQRFALIPKFLITQSERIYFFNQRFEERYFNGTGIDYNKIVRLINNKKYVYCIFDGLEVGDLQYK